jgi:putative ABC transport system substrate-binding protein
MKRREFISLLGGGAASASSVFWPLAARAQQTERMRRIGVLMPYTKDDPEDQQRIAALHDGLRQLGWIEGRNIQIEYRWYAGDAGRARSLAKELVDLRPELILVGAAPGMVALRQETHTVPIVFVSVTDPVGLGLVESLARPGGNATGFTFFEFSVVTKVLEALRQIAPRVTRVAIMYSPSSPIHAQFLQPIDAIPPSTAVTLVKTPVRDAVEIENALDAFGRETARKGSGNTIRPPSCYGVDVAELDRRAGIYVDRILKGGIAGQMQVQQPTRFQLVINLKMAKALGLTVPDKLLALADEVIE